MRRMKMSKQQSSLTTKQDHIRLDLMLEETLVEDQKERAKVVPVLERCSVHCLPKPNYKLACRWVEVQHLTFLPATLATTLEVSPPRGVTPLGKLLDF